VSLPPRPLAYTIANYDYYCFCCSYSTKVEKKKVATIQKHKKPTRKKPKKLKAKKDMPLSTLSDKERFF
jgi:hypothetical protein